MDRREVLKVMAAAVGSSVSLPPSVFGRMAESLEPSQLRFFRPAQRKQVAMLAEAIIPKTDTPGAIEASVPEWIEVLVQDCFSKNDQQLIVDGLALLTRRCQEEHGASLGELAPEQQVEFLTQVHEKGELRSFVRTFRELTKFTFVNSEVGGTQALEYMLVPAKWDPAMPISPGQKAWTIPT
jgi:hypothetical protein